MAETVVVVAPHPDDEAIGCGGMICLHRRRRDPVHVVFLTSGEKGLPGLPEETVRSIREAEARKAGNVLGVNGVEFLRLPDLGLAGDIEKGAKLLREVFEARRPDLVYLPHPNESHPDHEAAVPLVRAARQQISRRRKRPELRAYEIWTPMAQCGWVEDISDVMAKKLQAVRRYPSQLRLFRYDRAIRGLNLYRGALSGDCRYAEAFAYLEPIAPKPR
jgi:LmbE family N-acetylglucosaminyl deacetylase